MSEKTIDQLQSHLSAEPVQLGTSGYYTKEMAQRVICKDGISLSVQASHTHYCAPRSDSGPYYEVEVGFPSIVPPQSWMTRCEDESNPTETVYGYLSIDLVAKFIDEHGGMDFEAMAKAREQS